MRIFLKNLMIINNFGKLESSKKGQHLLESLKIMLPEFKFVQLSVMLKLYESLESFNKENKKLT